MLLWELCENHALKLHKSNYHRCIKIFKKIQLQMFAPDCYYPSRSIPKLGFVILRLLQQTTKRNSALVNTTEDIKEKLKQINENTNDSTLLLLLPWHSIFGFWKVMTNLLSNSQEQSNMRTYSDFSSQKFYKIRIRQCIEIKWRISKDRLGKKVLPTVSPLFLNLDNHQLIIIKWEKQTRKPQIDNRSRESISYLYSLRVQFAQESGQRGDGQRGANPIMVCNFPRTTIKLAT